MNDSKYALPVEKKTGRIKVSPAEQRTMDGRCYASKGEMNRCAELQLLQRAGLIRDLEIQPKFILQPEYTYQGKKVPALIYIADFRYFDIQKNQRIVEDYKGHRTEVYLIKKKILLYTCPDINFIETA
jgi:hypothetical protein